MTDRYHLLPHARNLALLLVGWALMGWILVACATPKSDEATIREEGYTRVYQDTNGVACYAPVRSLRSHFDYPFSCVKVR